MAAPYAFVTILTSDSYLPGALTLAGALKDLHPSPASYPEVDFQTVCLVTPHSVDVSTVKLLRRAFDLVIGVEPITSGSEKELQLLGRADLEYTPTKLHVFRLTQYSKVIFLDADVLPIRPLSHLFTLPHDFSAVPDVGWPDIFNSGVFVFSPGEEKFNELYDLLKSKGSWDGGDQGLLNEWRGSDWNRLSFTYNTTPTAAYTYAPAYEKYGSKISAIHFIGPDKPWHSIPWREPGAKISQSQDAQGSSQTRAYDYPSLVDKWYEVYDRHYRSRTSLPESALGSMRYVSAWNDPAEGVPSEAGDLTVGGGLGLDDLRKLAVEGMSAAPLVTGSVSGEGVYTSLPLENRLDLIPPLTEEGTKSTSEMQELPAPPSVSPPSQAGSHPSAQIGVPEPATSSVTTQLSVLSYADGLSTPLPDELPPTPHLGYLPLPTTPSPGPLHKFRARPDLGTPLDYLPDDGPSQRPMAQPRAPSPPLVSWNPAVEPPPTTVPVQSAFQGDTFFPNVWDQRRTEKTETSPPAPEALFQVPPPTEIPEPLLRQGHYQNVTGCSQESASPSPDRTKVKPLFPWENRPRHLPGRVFPSADTPPPGMFISPQSSPSDSLPEKRSPHQYPVPSPLAGMPPTYSFLNAWDTVPGIQRRPSKFARSLVMQGSPLGPAFQGSGRRPSKGSQSWEETAEASSRDADDEDEGEESEEDTERDVLDWTDSMAELPPTFVMTKGKKEYQVRGVQTAIETRNQAVLVTPALLKKEHEQEMPTSRKRDAALEASPARGPTLGGYSMVSAPVLGSEGTGAISPRDFSYSRGQSPADSTEELARRDGFSPPSSMGPVSPPDVRSLPWSQHRKVGRVWDPATGVEIFKRDTEEVWAKFVRMGTRGEDEIAAHQA